MHWQQLPLRGTFIVLAGLMLAGGILSADTPIVGPQQRAAALAKHKHDAAVDRARQQARLMHQVYASTLEAMHHHFFRRDRSVLPARAMEDVFADMESQLKIKARWIAVNTRAMSINHEPNSDFDKQAAAAIGSGKDEFELVENGHYHRAGAIPLGSGCVACHAGLFGQVPKTPRFAGLVISVPLNSVPLSEDAPIKK